MKFFFLVKTLMTIQEKEKVCALQINLNLIQKVLRAGEKQLLTFKISI